MEKHLRKIIRAPSRAADDGRETRRSINFQRPAPAALTKFFDSNKTPAKSAAFASAALFSSIREQKKKQERKAGRRLHSVYALSKDLKIKRVERAERPELCRPFTF